MALPALFNDGGTLTRAADSPANPLNDGTIKPPLSPLNTGPIQVLPKGTPLPLASQKGPMLAGVDLSDWKIWALVGVAVVLILSAKRG